MKSVNSIAGLRFQKTQRKESLCVIIILIYTEGERLLQQYSKVVGTKHSPNDIQL